ncbi:hypothetical protein Q3G72_002036 [Acer saccharum]|nr:hypothetical protein Q3G72_002036 [Acer saccharum]
MPPVDELTSAALLSMQNAVPSKRALLYVIKKWKRITKIIPITIVAATAVTAGIHHFRTPTLIVGYSGRVGHAVLVM